MVCIEDIILQYYIYTYIFNSKMDDFVVLFLGIMCHDPSWIRCYENRENRLHNMEQKITNSRTENQRTEACACTVSLKQIRPLTTVLEFEQDVCFPGYNGWNTADNLAQNFCFGELKL